MWNVWKRVKVLLDLEEARGGFVQEAGVWDTLVWNMWKRIYSLWKSGYASIVSSFDSLVREILNKWKKTIFLFINKFQMQLMRKQSVNLWFAECPQGVCTWSIQIVKNVYTGSQPLESLRGTLDGGMKRGPPLRWSRVLMVDTCRLHEGGFGA